MTRAARLIEHGQPLEVTDVELPEPGPDEVRVELQFGGVNPVDRYIAEGRVAPDGPLPRTLGGEASGTFAGAPVLVTGEGLGAVRDGVWAEAAVVPRAAVFEAPPGVDLRALAAMGVAGLTAWNVVRLADIGPDDRVLVLGASGGVGLPVVGMAASAGAVVWGQTGTQSKAAAIRSQGAVEVVVADASALAEALVDLRPTVVIDALGDGYTTASLDALDAHGRSVIFGTSAGPEAAVHLQGIYRKGLRVLGYAGLLLTREQRREGLEAALAALADGRLQIPIGRVVPLEQVNEALHLLADRAVTGKVLLALR
jgi:NADPH2:quinone reductase